MGKTSEKGREPAQTTVVESWRLMTDQCFPTAPLLVFGFTMN